MDWYSLKHILIDHAPDCSNGVLKALQFFYSELKREQDEERKIPQAENKTDTETI